MFLHATLRRLTFTLLKTCRSYIHDMLVSNLLCFSNVILTLHMSVRIYLYVWMGICMVWMWSFYVHCVYAIVYLSERWGESLFLNILILSGGMYVGNLIFNTLLMIVLSYNAQRMAYKMLSINWRKFSKNIP